MENNKPSALIKLLPNNDKELAILQERARKLAISNTNVKQIAELERYVEFKLGDNNIFGIPYDYIKEIISSVTPTRVPYASHYITGVINRYGSLISVIDLKKYFNLTESCSMLQHEKTSIIVIACLNITLGISVDQINGSSTYNLKELSPALQFNGSIPAKYVMGIDKKNVVILNIELFLTDLQKTISKPKEASL